MAIGQKIKDLRKENHVTQRALAKYLCITSQAISKWENGHTLPEVNMLPRIADMFGVSMDELFDYRCAK